MKKKENEIKPIEVPEKVKLQLDNFVLRLQKDFEQKERERAEQRLAIAENSKNFESLLTIITIISQALIVLFSFIFGKIAKIKNFTDDESLQYCSIIVVVLFALIIIEILFYKFGRRK